MEILQGIEEKYIYCAESDDVFTIPEYAARKADRKKKERRRLLSNRKANPVPKQNIPKVL